MPDYDPLALAAALPGDAPCGPDLEYDPAFLAMQRAGEGKPETQYGDSIQPAEDPDWPVVLREALALASRTRDLRVGTWLVRAGARVDGVPGAARGLRLLHALLENHWAGVHPQLDASEGDDPTARVSALMPLAHPAAGLADLRSATLTGGRLAIPVRQVELAAGGEPQGGEAVPAAAGVREGVAAALAEMPAVAGHIEAAHAAAAGVSTVLEAHLEASQTPDLGDLRKLLQRLAETVRAVGGGAELPAAAPAAGDAPSAAPAAALRATGAIASREDATRALERVCEWLEAHEPSHPAPLLIRRAQRLLAMDFLEIIQDIAPDGLGQVQRLAGTANT